MNSLKNRVQLIGRLGQDPDVRELEGGKRVARFNLATNESYRNGEGVRVEETTWHTVVLWNGLAELAAKYLARGRQVCLEGRISYRSYTDRNGAQKWVTEIIATDMVMLGQGNRPPELIGDEPDGDEAEFHGVPDPAGMAGAASLSATGPAVTISGSAGATAPRPAAEGGGAERARRRTVKEQAEGA